MPAETLKPVIDDQKHVTSFDEFSPRRDERQLLRQGEVVPLYSKAFDLLLVMVQKTAGAISRRMNCWSQSGRDRCLSKANLTVNFSGGGPTKLFDIPPQANFRYAIRWTARTERPLLTEIGGKDYGGNQSRAVRRNKSRDYRMKKSIRTAGRATAKCSLSPAELKCAT